MSSQDPLYVYGISGAPPPAPFGVVGVEGSPVRPVEHAGVVALTSPVHSEALGARDLRAHWKVLEQAFQDGPVLPVRFGTVLESEEALRARLIEPNAQRLSELLEEMAGRVQLNLRGRYVEDQLLKAIVRGSREIAALRKRIAELGDRARPAQQVQLGQLVEAAVARQGADDTRLVLDQLEPLAVAARAEEVSYPAAFNLAFLVERGRERNFSEVVSSIREELGERVALRYAGPLPPFSFIDTALPEAGASWA